MRCSVDKLFFPKVSPLSSPVGPAGSLLGRRGGSSTAGRCAGTFVCYLVKISQGSLECLWMSSVMSASIRAEGMWLAIIKRNCYLKGMKQMMGMSILSCISHRNQYPFCQVCSSRFQVLSVISTPKAAHHSDGTAASQALKPSPPTACHCHCPGDICAMACS